MKDLLSRCTFSFRFSFNNQIYRQIDGISVRFPLGLPLAVRIISKLEINQQSVLLLIDLTYRIDTTYVICDEAVNLNDTTFFQYLPSFHSCQVRKWNWSFNLISRCASEKEKWWITKKTHFWKWTWNCQLANSYSWVLVNRKRNLIYFLYYWISKICVIKEVEEERLTQNGYSLSTYEF